MVEYSPASSSRLPAIGRLAATFLVLLLIVVATQYVSGCYGDEFSDDAASHYISGLMIHDYIASGFPGSPLAYLKTFHSHYPLVGIGHWGPAFYGVEALWMLAFSTGRASVLLLSAVLTAVTALLVHGFAAPRLGRLAAWFAAIAVVVSPIIQAGASAVMLDVPIALACFVAMLAYRRYVDTGRWVFAALFGIVAAFAMLIKGNGALLALLPPFVVLLAWRWDLLQRWSFWLPVPIVAVIVVPWYALTYGMVAAGFRYHWGAEYFLTATAANAAYLLAAEGPLLLAAAIVGAILACARLAGQRADSGLVCAAALAAAVWVFQSVVPAALQDRYLAPLIPPLVTLAAVAVTVIARLPRVAARATAWTAPVMIAILGISLVPGAINAERLPHQGFIEAARGVWQHRTDANPSVLVAANGQGEAAAIAELAMLDPHRPSLFVVRGSRLLGGGGYNNADYLPRYAHAADVAAAIDAYAIPQVLFRGDKSPNAWAHLAQIEEVRASDPACWMPTFHNADAPVMLYELCRNQDKTADTAKLTALSAPAAFGANRGDK